MKIISAIKKFEEALKNEVLISKPILEIAVHKDVFDMLMRECNDMMEYQTEPEEQYDGSEFIHLWDIKISKLQSTDR